jgi:tRNA (Thr-GGU) A37 N-methylase
MRKHQSLELKPIGVIHSPYKDRQKAPCQGYKGRGISKIEVFEEFEQGLQDIEGFSHVIVAT